jgi:hypothetical protein
LHRLGFVSAASSVQRAIFEMSDVRAQGGPASAEHAIANSGGADRHRLLRHAIDA